MREWIWPELAFGMPIVVRQCLLHRIGGRSTMGDAEGFKDGPRIQCADHYPVLSGADNMAPEEKVARGSRELF